MDSNFILCFSPNSDLVAVLKQMLGVYIKRSMYLPLKLTLESLVDLCFNGYMNPEVLLKIVDKSACDIHHPSVIPRYSIVYITIYYTVIDPGNIRIKFPK